MKASAAELAEPLVDWVRSRSGSTAVIFGLAFVPVMLMLGAAVDYMHSAGAKSRVSAASDSAALSGVGAAMQYISANGVSPSALAAAATQAQSAATNAFNANLVGLNGTTVNSINVSPTVNGSGVTVSVTAQVGIPTAFMKIVGIDSVPVTTNATAQASASTPYIDIYVLVDASASMGIGASLADQTAMQNDPNIGCVLACHNDHAADPSYVDNVTYARSKGYNLRFDVVRNALTTISTQAQSYMANTGAHVRFGIYSFADYFNTEVGITSNYGSASSPGSILYALANMDIAQADSGTSTKYALDQLLPNISPAPGTGASVSSPAVFVLLLTDGVSNATDTQAGPSGYNWTYSTTFYPAFNGSQSCWPGQTANGANLPSGTPLPPPCTPDTANQWEMQLNTLNPSWCNPIKAMGATLMTLNTQYVLATTQYDWRTIYLQTTLIPQIQSDMQNCASSAANAFIANDAGQVQTAIAAMFTQAIKPGQPHLIH